MSEVYTPELKGIRGTEEEYCRQRRIKAAKELRRTKRGKKIAAYAARLADGKRPPVGLAFSGGGIRSATFNLGVVQALSKLGILSWVDYLTSVSGGGFTASCLTSLLSHEEKRVILPKVKAGMEKKEEEESPTMLGQLWKRLMPEKAREEKSKRDIYRYYPLTTQWERFPLNPDLQVFDGEGVAYGGKKGPMTIEDGMAFDFEKNDLPLRQSSETDRNKQLEHLRNMGNYLIPRTGFFTLDVMRAIGAFLLRVAYTLLIFLFAMTVLAAIHYAIAAAFTPELPGAFQWDGKTPSLFTLVLASVDRTSLQYGIPWGTYLNVFLSGAGFSLLMIFIASFLYRRDVTTENRYRVWKSPGKSGKVTTYTWVLARGVMMIAFLSTAALAWLTGRLWYAQYANLAAAQSGFYWTTAGLFSVCLLAALYFIFFYAGKETWAQQGLPEQDWINKLVVYLAALLTLWSMTYILASLRIGEAFDENKLRIYWIWMPALFLFGGGWGLIVFQYFHDFPVLKWLITHRVQAPGNLRYDEKSVNVFTRAALRFALRLARKGDPIDKSNIRYSKGIRPYSFNIWSSADFRSIYWTMQGFFFYGTLGILLIGAVLIPHYFVTRQAAETQTYVSLSLAILSGAWSSYLASRKSNGGESWLGKVLSLPAGIRQIVLALLVFVFTLSVLFLIQIALDALAAGMGFPHSAFHWETFAAAGGAFVLLLLLGRVNANYLSAHYFFRDRVADAFLRTEMDDLKTGGVHFPRDDRDRLMSHIIRNDCSAPYHIVVTALNLAGSWFLQFKDRKSQPFIFSRDYCGSEITGYVQTWAYRGNSSKYSQMIALSGAAVSSALGYYTFFAQAFVTTLFNLRLGLWLDNPYRYKGEEHPRALEDTVSWLPYLWDEARGRISERGELVNLTDGGHTDDNIGLYPLFQRRCRVIIAGDASQDPKGECEPLMAVIRQVKIDLGIEVEINVEDLKPETYDTEKKTASESKSHFAIGTITYPPTKDNPKPEKGWLIYLKPAIVAGDPAPLLKFWERNKMDFPHPSTADQFFDEEQFENQRLLGEHTVASAWKEIKALKNFLPQDHAAFFKSG